MAKRVFFSFHYQDVVDFRANTVRNHKLTKDNKAGYFDASIWEDAKKTSELALKRLINKELINTSVTCVLVGTHTYERRWVDYEIMKSLESGNNILAIHINGIKGKDGKTKSNGNNPLFYLGYSFDNTGKKLSLHNYIQNEWQKYTDLDGWTVKEVAESNRNKIFRLSTDYSIYDWIKDDGYNNFDKWI
ncbi:TIR domain-containing protein [Ulvibacter litoralis]|uniref:MTH538 TIR-like domain n=1 Tax=Ulvibacter litoralis TaxID=227084 RepID=A0A1G7DMR0_9FLAO|nr:TIR domain-containing protein [Ulvibacter litoralis]GHC43005.1 hypothetical protein GCM10008083_01600 [Ulvibacter litoralis]SDE52410.1 MTH538 TIR-like domain [Ulvibacter litoralis]